MNTITIKNLSTYTDAAVVISVGMYMNGEKTIAVQDERGEEAIAIKHRGNTYTVTDHVRSCRLCGCTDSDACPGGCYWVEKDLCSQCVNKETEK